MSKKVLEKCTQNGLLVLLLHSTQIPKLKSMTLLTSLYNNKRLSETLVQLEYLKFVRTCFKWLVHKIVSFVVSVKKQQNLLTWIISRTIFQSVYLILIPGKKKDKFIFTVESVGQLTAASIVKKSMEVLRTKLRDLRQRIEWVLNIF